MSQMLYFVDYKLASVCIGMHVHKNFYFGQFITTYIAQVYF